MPNSGIGVETFFITGGTLPADASSYVQRRADAELLACLLRGDFCYVLNTRQVGKSSLMIRTAEQIRAAGRQVAMVDLTAIGQNLTVEQWYYGILGRVGKQLGLYRELTAFWQSQRGLGPMQRWMEAIRQIVLPQVDKQVSAGESPTGLVMFVDEIDAVLALGFSADEFLAGIRECYNRRAQDPLYRLLTFCLLGVATPADLIRETRVSPFNIGRRIELQDFTVDEAAPLACGLQSFREHAPPADQLLARILYWTSGHPYMTQRLCRAAAEALADSNVPPPRDATAVIDPLSQSLFLSRRAQETDDNLVFVRNRLLKSEVDLAGLLDLYLRVRSGRGVKDDETNPYCSSLRLSGVVKSERGELRLRNRIYDHVFDRDWILTHMPGAELRRQRAAYRRGQIRTAAFAAAALLIVGSLAGWAIYGENRARKAERRAVTQQRIATDLLSRSHVANGIRLMDSGDLPGALLPLAEALRLDGTGPRVSMDRARLAAVLSCVSIPEKMWFSGGPVRWADYSPDGSKVVTASDDGIAQVWDVASGDPASPPWKHPGAVTFAAFSPDGKRVVTCASDFSARIWRVGGADPIQVLAHPAPVVHAAWNRAGDRLATVCYEQLAVWDMSATAPGGKLVASDKSQHAKLSHVAFSPNGRRLAFVAENFSAWIVDAETLRAGVPLGSNNENRCYAGRSVEYSPSGDRLVVAGSFGDKSQETGACVYDAVTGWPLYKPLHHGSFGTAARFSLDGKRIVTAGEDQTVRLWNATTGKALCSAMQHSANVSNAAFSPDGSRIVTVCGDDAQVWDTSGRRVGPALRHAGRLTTARFDPSGGRILTAGRDHSARVWPLVSESSASHIIKQYPVLVRQEYLAGGKYVLTLYGYWKPGSAALQEAVEIHESVTGRRVFPAQGLPDGPGMWTGFTTSSDGRRVALYGHGGVQMWNPETGETRAGPIEGDWANFSENGRKLLVRTTDGKVRVIDVDSGRDIHLDSLRVTPSMDAWCRLLNPDGTRVVTRLSPSTLAVCDATTGRQITPPMPHPAGVFLIRFSPNGRLLFVWCAQQRVYVWDTQTGRSVTTVPFVPGFAPSRIAGVQEGIIFNVRGDRALTGSSSVPSLQFPTGLWDLSAGQPVRNVLQPLPVATSPQFSPDGTWFATNGTDSRIWDSGTGAPLTPVFEHGGPVNCVAFSPDGRLVITASADSTARIWNAKTGMPVSPSLLHTKAVNSASFCADGLRVVTGAADGTFRVWDAVTGEALTPAWRQGAPVIHARFTSDGQHIIAVSEKEARVWNIPAEQRSANDLILLAELVSGQRIDTLVGVTNTEPARLQQCWEAVRASVRQ